MALAAVRSQETTAPTLADRVAEAQRAEVRPRNRLGELQAAFDQALGAKRYADADGLQNEISAAREALAVCEGTTRGLREGLAVVEAERAAQQEAIAAAQRRDEAQRIIGDAVEQERQGLDQIEAAVASMKACLGAARDAFHLAQSWETKVGQERGRAMSARVTLGEIPYPPPRAVAPNAASVLAERDQLVRALMAWDGR